ncbi:MAG: DNA mismatch repair endonuclease MutL [Thermodesulfobacteriota bacterium]
MMDKVEQVTAPSQGKIRVMAPELAGKIAAGEVVERPSSVVKELVENAIDAGAGRIAIHIKDGGKLSIKIVDDGEGMTRSDALIAFERHATSKIMSEDDLESLVTMGFRGEALPSIASVSEVELLTKVRGSVSGTVVKVRGSKVAEVADHGAADGTSIEVNNLFFNTPARRKFLRSAMTEFGHIKDVVERIALACPSIGFQLSNGRNLVLNSPPTGREERIRDVLSRYKEMELMPVEFSGDHLEISGVLSTPDLSLATTKGFYVYVNQRLVRDKGINRAIINGVRGLFMDGRFPVAILYIAVSPADVDINVHPAKSEVRFRLPVEVYREMSRAISDAFLSGALSRGSQSSEGREVRELSGEYGGSYRGGFERGDSFRPPGSGSGGYGGNSGYGDYGARDGDARGVRGDLDEEPSDGLLPFANRSGEAKNPHFLDMEVVGQLWGEYLICSREDEFYIIDQHAAAERVLFEKLKGEYYADGCATSQLLLVPEVIELSPVEHEFFANLLSFLTRLGFTIEPFGGTTFIIKAIPTILSGKRCQSLIKDLVEEMATIGVSSRVEERIEEVLQRIACHGVIRGPRDLPREEARSLLAQMSETDLSSHCPHGRPSVKVFSKGDLEVMFKRR